MTPKEELIQAIERSSDETVDALLKVLKTLQLQRSPEFMPSNQCQVEGVSKRLYHKQGILVIETGSLKDFDINKFIGDLREERIQDQIEQEISSDWETMLQS
ncbi:MAG: hypothetical protein KME17_26200 [Cyanosarcina radialis HA8281-LM2]|jgi:hypothetical protein|nr:hypothetical protein [Cyanosarcina radialis HA8281-LM2]